MYLLGDIDRVVVAHPNRNQGEPVRLGRVATKLSGFGPGDATTKRIACPILGVVAKLVEKPTGAKTLILATAPLAFIF